mmetsp:Transcript_10539/g.22415  ORF Transcript_10539/g.22415 Transcript_10539/m.22415 type:complete len:82 (-) Transcript_10539:753-998(-)
MPRRIQSSETLHPIMLRSGMLSFSANNPTVTPVTIVDKAAYVQMIIARPSFIPRFWQKMPVDEHATLMPTPSTPNAGNDSS